MKVRIDIDTKTFVRFWLVVIAFIFAIYLIYLSRTALGIIGASLFLAVALNYPVSWLSKKLPGKGRLAATAMAFVLVVLLIGMVIFLVIPPILQQTAKVVETVPRLVSQASTQWTALGNLIQQYHIEPQVDAAVKSIQANISGWLSSLGGNVVLGIGTLTSNATAAILTLVASFLMLIEGPNWIKKMWMLYDNEKTMQHHKHIMERMNNAVAGYVNGQLTMSGIGGLVTGVIVFLISMFTIEVPTNLALPSVAIMFLLSLIPMFGTTIAAILIAILLALNNVSASIIFLIVFFLYQQIENNILYPMVQSRFVEMSPLVILIAVTMGLYLFGLAGGIISIPVAGVIKVLLEELIINKRMAKVKASKKKTA